MKSFIIETVPMLAAINLAVIAAKVETGNMLSTLVFRLLPAVLALGLAAPIAAKYLN